MPLYSYEIIDPDGGPGEVVELFQRMADAPLTEHPETGQPIRRLISAPNIGGEHSDRAVNRTLKDNKRLEQMGFTKYERRGKGAYERTAGSEGPKTISTD